MTPRQSQLYLKSFINHEHNLNKLKRTSFKLKRMQSLLQELKFPQNNLKIIHVAGSKGKGSICAITANILKESGFKVGLYTSPHLNTYRERIRVLENTNLSTNVEDVFPDMISEEELCAVLSEIQPQIEKIRSGRDGEHLSFFEVFTALALYYFSKRGVDFVVLETGLGGRLDATNAIDSQVAVIAPISLEHTHILGNDITKIAQEKAAIIKDKEQKVVIAPQESQVNNVLKKQCAHFLIDPLWIDSHFQINLIGQNLEGQSFDLISPQTQYQLSSSLLGEYQRDNCAVAVGIVEALQDLGAHISKEDVQEGIKNVFWPGRFEIIKNEPRVILDCAHNKASISALMNLMESLFGDKKITLILGFSEDKNSASIYDELAKFSKHIIFVQSHHPRAKKLPGAVGVSEALELVSKNCEKDDVILVTGSIFVVSEARAIIQSSIVSTASCIN